MTPIITSHHGAVDAIRWGDVSLAPGKTRRFTHDLLSNTVRLYLYPTSGDYAPGGKFTEDLDAANRAAVLGVLTQ